MTGTDTWDHSCAAGNRKEILQCEGTGVIVHAGSFAHFAAFLWDAVFKCPW